MADLLYFNGIDGDAGGYVLPPMSGEELYNFITGAGEPEEIDELRHRYESSTQEHFGVVEGVDPKDLAASGWGVIFAHDADPAIEAALGELLAWRREQAGDHFRIYSGGEGFRVGRDNKNAWLARHGAGPGPADPDKVPYYLLIVGGPDKIPYRFQSQLDVQYAVGRVHFATEQEYANYAQSVVRAEKDQLRLARSAAFFGVANPDDPATQLSTDQLLEPLYHKYQIEAADWHFDAYLRQDATKAQLARLLGGDETPALLISGSHGMGFPLDSPRQLPHQGALLCQDWPGPKDWQGRGPIPQDFYFAGDDLAADARLHGLVAFMFACYGAGTPQHDEFSKQAFRDREQIAPHAFLAQLPSDMLSHPSGGALAVIGHVDRAWGYSFSWPKAGAQTAVFESTIQRLLDGHPVGSALEYFNERYAELSTMLSDQLEEIEFGAQANPYEVAGMWTANNDARGYAVIGDPAVRLAVAEPGEAAAEREPITVVGGRRPTTDDPTTDDPTTDDEAVDDNSAVVGSYAVGDATAPPADDDRTVVVETYAAADPATGEGRRLAARTELRLDGDTQTVVAEWAGEETALLATHQAMVREAVAARLGYLQDSG